MAMFLSRIKKALNLGTKSITANGTYNASTDGYDGYSSVEVNVPQITPTSITPSNATPAALTADTPVNPTANGYAIASYNTKTPSNSSPAVLESGEIDKIGGNGYAIQHYDMVTPSSTPTSVSAYDVVMIGGSGVIVDSIPVPPSVTPSNASPAALTSGSAVTPSANGYAIESYSNISPYEGGAITSGGIYKATTSGYAIGEEPETLAAGSGTDETIVNGKYYHAVGNGVAIQEYTNITPSNSSPVSLSSGDYYKPTASGKAVASVTDITPSNSSPVSLSSGTIYKPSASGYAISSYSSKTPSDSSPASVSSGAIIKASASGYLYSTIQPKFKAGTVTTSTSATTYVNVGFKPKFIGWVDYKDSTHLTLSIYNQDISTGATYRGAVNGTSQNCATFSLPQSSTSTNAAKILSIDSTGFTIDKTSTNFGTNAWYFAIG